MPDSTLSALTASTPGTAGLLYTVQGGADRKLSMTAAGAQMLEAANAAAQQVLLGITGGGAISLGGYTLTVPATGTAALLGTANSFTAGQTIAPSSAATCLTLTGGTVTTSNPLISATQTWNAVGTTFHGALINVTNTASSVSSSLLTMQVGGSSLFEFRRTDNYWGTAAVWTSSGGISFQNIQGGILLQIGGALANIWATGRPLDLGTTATTFSFSTSTAGVTTSVGFAITANHILQQRSSTNAQTYQLYGTYTDASNYTRLSLAATSTTMTIAAETAGTGADNIDLTLTPAGTGVVQFGTHSALAAETVTGYITIKDAAGNSRKIAVVS